MKKIRRKPSTSRKTTVISGRRLRVVGDIESPVVPPEAWEYD